MKTIIAAGVSISLIAFATIVMLLAGGLREPSAASQRLESTRADIAIAAERQAGQLDQQRAAQWATIEAAWITPAWGLLGATIPTAGVAIAVLVVVALAGGLLALADSYLLRRRPMVWANGGLLPVDRSEVRRLTPTAVGLLENSQRIEGARIVASATPRRAEVIDHPETATPILEDAGGLPTAPSYSQLLADGWRPSFNKFTLGYSANGPVYGTVDDLLSTLVVGRPGTGKTTLLRLLLAQLLDKNVGAEVAILDPHGGLSDLADIGGLARWHAEGERQIEEASRDLIAELDRRLEARKAGERHFRPLLLLADEWNILSEMAPDAAKTARRFILEARKVRGYAIISGQGAPAASFGGSVARDGLSSRYIGWTTSGQARMAGLDCSADEMKALLGALRDGPKGRAILARATSEPLIVSIPNTTASDLSRVVAEVAEVGNKTPAERVFSAPVWRPAPASDASPHFPATSDPFKNDEQAEVDEKLIQVRQLLREKASQTEILAQVWGVESRGGRAYNAAADEFRDILARMAEED